MKDRKSKLDAHEDLLRQWFGEDNVTLQDARARLAELKVTTSIANLSNWWAKKQQADMQDALLAGIASGSALCTELDRALGKAPEPSLQAVVKLLKIVVMRLAAQGQLDVENLKLVDRLLKPIMDFADGERRDRQIAQDERKLKILEDRAAKAVEAERILQQPELSQAEKIARMRENFGIG